MCIRDRGIVCTLGAGALVGLIMGVVVVYGRLPDIIVTLAFSYIWKGVALTVLPSPGGYVNPDFTAFLSGGSFFPPAIVIVALSLLLWKLFKTTKPGLDIYAVGGNPRAAYESGLNVQRAKLTAYLVSGVFLGIAGLLLTGQISSGDPTKMCIRDRGASLRISESSPDNRVTDKAAGAICAGRFCAVK